MELISLSCPVNVCKQYPPLMSQSCKKKKIFIPVQRSVGNWSYKSQDNCISVVTQLENPVNSVLTENLL